MKQPSTWVCCLRKTQGSCGNRSVSGRLIAQAHPYSVDDCVGWDMMPPQELTRVGSICPSVLPASTLPHHSRICQYRRGLWAGRALHARSLRTYAAWWFTLLPQNSFVFNILPKFSCFFHIIIPVMWSFVTGHLPSFIISDVCDVKPLEKAHLFNTHYFLLTSLGGWLCNVI